MARPAPALRATHLTGALSAAIGALLCCYPAPSADASFNPFGNAAALDDEALSKQRGGFISPEGVRVAIGYTMETQVNGALVMRSHVTIDPRAAGAVPYQGSVTVANVASSPPSGSVSQTSMQNEAAAAGVYLVPQVTNEPGRQIISIRRPSTSIDVASVQTTQPQSVSAPPASSVTQALESTQISLDTAQFSSTVNAAGYQGHYQGQGIDVVHQIQGGVPAAVVSNTGNNRLVDHRTIVNLDLSDVNLPPSATLRAVNAGIANGLRTFR